MYSVLTNKKIIDIIFIFFIIIRFQGHLFNLATPLFGNTVDYDKLDSDETL